MKWQKKNEFLKKVSLVINQFNDFATKFGKAKKNSKLPKEELNVKCIEILKNEKVYDTWPEYFLRKVTELLQKDLECDKSTLDKSIEIFLNDFPDFSSFDLQAKKEKEKEQEEKLKEKRKK